jgi:hypothetical protein
MVARVGKIDLGAVPLGLLLSRVVPVRIPIRAFDPIVRAFSNKRIRVDRTSDGNFVAVLIDGPKPNRLPVTEIRSPLDGKLTEDTEPAAGVPTDQV